VGGDGGCARAEGRGAGVEEGGCEGGGGRRKSASGERSDDGGDTRRQRQQPPRQPQKLEFQKVFHGPSQRPTRSHDGLHGRRRSHHHASQDQPCQRHLQLITSILITSTSLHKIFLHM